MLTNLQVLDEADGNADVAAPLFTEARLADAHALFHLDRNARSITGIYKTLNPLPPPSKPSLRCAKTLPSAPLPTACEDAPPPLPFSVLASSCIHKCATCHVLVTQTASNFLLCTTFQSKGTLLGCVLLWRSCTRGVKDNVFVISCAGGARASHINFVNVQGCTLKI